MLRYETVDVPRREPHTQGQGEGKEEDWIVGGGRAESLNVVLCTAHVHGMS